MTKCIFCGDEIEGTIKEHMLQKHIGTPQVAPTPAITPKNTTQPQEIIKSENKEITKSQNNEIPKSLKSEKPKKRYLSAEEILNLLQNTNKQFPTNEIQGSA
jgi:hypothetical protein